MSLSKSVRGNTQNMISHAYSFCSEVRNLECLGVEGISENPARPIQIVNLSTKILYFDGDQTYKDKYPGPPRFATDTIHVLNCWC